MCALGDDPIEDYLGAMLTPEATVQLNRLRPYMCDESEIEIRQCSSAGGNGGTRLLQALQEATGASSASGYTDLILFGFSGTTEKKTVNEDGDVTTEGGWGLWRDKKKDKDGFWSWFS